VILFLDVETTKKPVFKPWQREARLCAIGLGDDSRVSTWLTHHSEYTGDQTHSEIRDIIQDQINSAALLVGHNLKFDLLWLRHFGIQFEHVKLWDTQIVEYLMTGQSGVKTDGFYTLEETSVRYGGERKLDIIKTEYWDRGIDTPDVPAKILLEYLQKDVEITRELYYRQQSRVLPRTVPHIRLACEEMRALVDIEMEGMWIDKDVLVEQSRNYRENLKAIDGECRDLIGRPINLDSGVQLSVALYGGYYSVGAREWFYSGEGPKRRLRSRKTTLDKYYPGLGFKPLPNTEVKNRTGIYQTNKDVLNQLTCRTKGQRTFKRLLLERAKIKKQIELIETDTGKGMMTLIESGKIHTEYNQTVTVTTCLSSKNPNLQNLPREGTAPVKLAFVSGYEE